VGVLALGVLTAPPLAWSDQPMDAVRITCIPEMRYFEFEYKELPSEATDYIATGFEVQEKKPQIQKRWNILKKQGLYSPQKLTYECKLPKSTYRLSGNRGEASAGRCGSAPDISISLTHNGGSFISDVLFGPACFERPSIDRVAIFDGEEGWAVRNVTVCVRGNAPNVLDYCKYLDGLPTISRSKIEEFLKKKGSGE